MVGRILRPDPATGKASAILLDHAGATWNHGFITDRIAWTLKTDKRAENVTEKSRRTGQEKLRECPQCSAVMITPPCMHCGSQPAPRRGQDRDFVDDELGLVVNGKAQAHRFSDQEKLTWYKMLIGEALRRGKNPNWAFYLFQDKFKHKPGWHWDRTALEPSFEVRAFVRSRCIAYAKARGPAA